MGGNIRKTLGCLALFCMAVFTVFAEESQKKKVIFDTDIGGDIDDAFAHGLMQVSPEFEVLGITVADGPTAERARVSCRMLYECGQEGIPVYVGRRTRGGGDIVPQLTWGAGFDKLLPREKPAAEFIVETLRKYPNEVTIISVGPLSNLADAIELDPEAWKLVKEVYSMFGSFYRGYRGVPTPNVEWNVKADIRSAQKVVNSGVPITIAGLDVTDMVYFRADRIQKLLLRNSPLTDAICGLYILWTLYVDRDPILFDPVAVAMAITDKFVETRKVHVRVTDEGYTVVEEGKQPNCQIGMRIDKDAILDWITERLLKQNLLR